MCFFTLFQRNSHYVFLRGIYCFPSLIMKFMYCLSGFDLSLTVTLTGELFTRGAGVVSIFV